MFTIIGADQKLYGPYTADEIREWVAQGRADGRTLARLDGSADWKPLAEFPEFAGLASAADAPPRLASSPPAYAPQYSNDPAAQILARDPDFDLGECISRGGSLLKNNFALLAGASAIAWFIDDVLGFVPLIGILFHGVLFGGLFFVFVKRVRGEAASLGDTFSGFSGSFIQLALTGFLTTLLTSLAFCACILPMIYLLIAWIFALALVIDKKLEFWTAMELSRKVATRVWFKVFALVLVVFAPILLMHGYVTFKTWQMMDAQVTPLLAHAAVNLANLPALIDKITPALENIVRETASLKLASQLVFLVNLPFGVAVLMYAYESLFGTRRAPSA